ncbi:hypothetical protein EDD16DRAFT_1059838 [Pisolithus croceorrhizus]|nr:hypothetical protein EDD16DRAFT_1059838 [Pisolithus croceorrhizus]
MQRGYVWALVSGNLEVYPMGTSKRSKVSRKRRLRADELNDIILRTSKDLESQSESHVKDEEELGIVVPLNIGPVKIEEKVQPEPEVVEHAPAKRRKVRFATASMTRQQAERHAPVRQQTAPLSVVLKSSGRVGGTEVRDPGPAQQPEAQEISTAVTWHRRTDDNRQLGIQRLESRLETSLAEAERLSKIVPQLLMNAEWIEAEIKSIRAGINALQNSQTLCRCGCPAECCR